MDRELKADTIRNREAFRETVKKMTIAEIATLSDELRERMDDLVEELEVLSDQVTENRARVAAIARANGQTR
jgi:hypothetical protein